MVITTSTSSLMVSIRIHPRYYLCFHRSNATCQCHSMTILTVVLARPLASTLATSSDAMSVDIKFDNIVSPAAMRACQ